MSKTIKDDVVENKEVLRKEIQQHTDEFLKNGGQIQSIKKQTDMEIIKNIKKNLENYRKTL